MNYHPHVDGLRALAIILVLLFHAGLPLFPSGFIGVDIFFVISGFLITGLIHHSLEKNDFSLIQFYNRRLWRLQPVFICLLVITTLLALCFYIPEDLLQYAKSARKTALFISNQYFGRVTKGYFAENPDYLSLLHTWSLSIEWQCYLVLPIGIYLLHRSLSRQSVVKCIYLLTLALLTLALYFSVDKPNLTYYQFLSRLFEFMIGSCLALQAKKLPDNPLILNVISISSFFVLLYIARAENIYLGFPNGYSLLLCIATALLIATGEKDYKPIVIQLLSLKPMVFIGLLSYSLYIWHWPIFVIIRYLNIQETPWVLGVAFCLVFTVGYFSWRFIEKPARKLSHIKFSQSLVYLFILPILFFHFAAKDIKKHEGYPQRFVETKRIYTLLKQYTAKERSRCLNRGDKKVGINSQCLLGAKNSNSRKGLMIGDSYANHYWQFMESLAKTANISILAHSTANCLSLPGIAQYDWENREKGIYKVCLQQNKLYYKMIRENHYAFVIVGQAWSSYLFGQLVNKIKDQRSFELTKSRMTKAMEKALQLIIDSGARPVFIAAIALPKDHSNPHDCFFKTIKRGGQYEAGRCDFSYNPLPDQWVNGIFLQMKKKYPQLIIIDPKKVQCIQDRCRAEIKGLPLFRDLTHLTDYASYKMAKIYAKQFQNPLY